MLIRQGLIAFYHILSSIRVIAQVRPLVLRGGSVNALRKRVMLVCALLVEPVIAAPKSTIVFSAVLLIGITASAHQAWPANIFTFVSDIFPKRAVGSVTGLGGAAGAAGGMLFASSAGHIIEKMGSYTVLFLIAGSAYLLAFLIIHLLAPRLEPAKFDEG